jgi:hypothetical protein
MITEKNKTSTHIEMLLRPPVVVETIYSGMPQTYPGFVLQNASAFQGWQTNDS